MPLQTPSQLLPGLIAGASLRLPKARPPKYAKMSAAQTRTNAERMKLSPIALALASASHAVQSATRPIAQRSARGTRGQPATPLRRTHAPPSTHVASATHHARRGAVVVQPAYSASAQARSEERRVGKER